MPAAAPFLAVLGGATAWQAGAIFALQIVQMRRENASERSAAAAAREALRSRNITIRSAVAPRRYVLGTARLSGPVMYAEFCGDDQQYLDTVVALTHGEVSEMLGVYLGDEYISAADITAGVPDAGKYSADPVPAETFEETVALTAGTTGYTVTHTPIDGIVYVVTGTISVGEDAYVQQLLSLASVVGKVVTFSAPLAQDSTLAFNYQSKEQPSVAAKAPLHVQFYTGSSSQATVDWTDVATPKWTSSHRLQGVGYVRALKLIDSQPFLAGTNADVGALVKGPKDVYDPRITGTVSYTSNPALLAAWFRTLPRVDGGLGIPAGWIDWDTVGDAADVCDELISVRKLDDTGYEDVKRYECHTVLSLDQQPMDNLQVILDSMAGDFPFTGGAYRCYAGEFRTATLTITDADVAQDEPITFSPLSGGGGESAPNMVTARFVDAARNYIETQARPVVNSSYVTADGAEETLELDLVASTDERQANYLMGVRLERARPALAARLTVTGVGANIALLDTVQLDLDGYSSVSSKTFEVRRRTNHWNGRYTLELREVKASTYALDADRFTAAAEVAPPDNDALFSVAALTTVTAAEELVIQADGSRFSRAVVAWDVHSQGYVTERGHIQLRYRRAGGEWIYNAPVDGSSVGATTGPLQDNTVTMIEVRAVNGAGAAGPWTVAAPLTISGKAGLPENVSGFTASVTKGRAAWVWDQCTDIDYGATEVRTSDANWGSSSVQPLFRGKANQWQEIVATAATYTRYAKHLDLTGNASATAASYGLVVSAGDLVQDGADGAAAVAAGTDKAAVVLPSDSLGVVPSAELPVVVTAYAKLGGAIDTSNWSWSRTSTAGITTTIASSSNPAVSITAMSSSLDSGIVTITGTKSGYDDIVIVIPVTKAKAASPAESPVAAPGTFYVAAGTIQPANAVAALQIRRDGSIYQVVNGTASKVGDWYRPNATTVGDAYDVRFDQISSETSDVLDTTTGVGAFVAITSTRTVQLTCATDGTDVAQVTATYTIQDAGLPVSSGIVNLEAITET